MVLYGLFIACILCICYCILSVINKGWLMDKGEETVKFAKALCNITVISSFVALIIGMLLTKIL